MTELHPRLKAVPLSLGYDFAAHVGILRLRHMGCVDMYGCLGMFSLIDPDVQRVETGNEVGDMVVYERRHGQWIVAEDIHGA